MTTKLTRKERRAQAAQKFKDQKTQQAKDFDFTQNDRKKHKEGGKTHISGQETRFLRKTHGARETYAALQEQQANGAEFGGRAQKKMDRMGKRIEKIDARRAAKEKAKAQQGSTGAPENPIDSTATGSNDNVPSNEGITDDNAIHAGGTPGFYENQPNTEIENTQTQQIDQDNDQTSTINGDNNTVYQEQDNSIRQYGGDNRSFVYNGGGGNSYNDTPASMATLAGFYDVDDSPAAQAKQFDLYNDLNNQSQKRYAGEALKTANMFGNFDARDYTSESIENASNRATQNFYDRSDVETALTFGDVWNKDYMTEKWQNPEAPAEIKSEAGELAEDAKDDIEDM